MSKAYVDTSVLADALLKPTGELGKAAKRALKRYKTTLLPEFALKELKAGPLNGHVWLYNKLTGAGSFYKIYSILHRESRTPRRNTLSTALEALALLSESIASQTKGDLKHRYGHAANEDVMQCDEYRFRLRYLVTTAWKKRRKMTTEVVHPLSCYEEIAPYEERGLLVNRPMGCRKKVECCLATALNKSPDSLEKLRDAAKANPSNESQKRYKILKDMHRKRVYVDDSLCRSIGDAFFAFYAPADAVILTTNTKDHESLAAVVGKKVERP